MTEYYTIVTDTGAARIANAALLGQKVDITHFAVGDGGGAPEPGMTALKNEVWRGGVTSCEADESSPNLIRVRALLPSSVGGFTIRELGVFDSEANLIAVGSTPDTPKLTVAEGVSSEMELTLELLVSNTEVLQCTIDPTVLIATKAEVQAAVAELHTKTFETHPLNTANYDTEFAWNGIAPYSDKQLGTPPQSAPEWLNIATLNPGSAFASQLGFGFNAPGTAQMLYFRNNWVDSGHGWFDWVPVPTSETVKITTLLNGWHSWANMDAYFPRVTRCGDMVTVAAVLENGVTASECPLFILPGGYQPAIMRAVTVHSLSGPRNILINVDGTVNIDATGLGAWAAGRYFFNFTFPTKEG